MRKQEALRERVYRFYNAKKSEGKMFTIEHFKAEGEHPTTIRRIIDRFNAGIAISHQSGAGRPVVKMSESKVKLLLKHFDHQKGRSCRNAAARFKVSKSYVGKILKTKSSIRCHKKTTIPKRTEKQKSLARSKCARLSKFLKNIPIVMDDESYFTLSHATINGNGTFYSSNVAKTPASVKYRPKAKFEEKVLVWVAASSKGLSKPLITKSGLAVNQDIYREQCIRRRLVPFLNLHHSDGNYQFWPDLASSHYAESVMDYMIENGVNFVEKYDNPANLPEVRPIEDFWAILKGQVYKNGWEAKSVPQLIQRIRYCLSTFEQSTIQSLFSSIPRRLDNVRRKGVIERRS